MSRRPNVWVKGPGSILPEYTLLEPSCLPSILTTVALIRLLEVRPDLFHVFFMGQSLPVDNALGSVILQDDCDLMQLATGASDLYFRVELVPLDSHDFALLYDRFSRDFLEDKSDIAHLLARPPSAAHPHKALAAKAPGLRRLRDVDEEAGIRPTVSEELGVELARAALQRSPAVMQTRRGWCTQLCSCIRKWLSFSALSTEPSN